MADRETSLPWQRGFGWAFVIAGVLVGLTATLGISDPSDNINWDLIPVWVRPLPAIPFVLFGLTFVVNRSYFRVEDGALWVQARPVPMPATRTYPVTAIESVELRQHPEHDRLDLVVHLHSQREPARLYKGVQDEIKGDAIARQLNAAIEAARGAVG